MEEIKYFVEDEFDIIVVGAGHAGCEAGLASSRLGKENSSYNHVLRVNWRPAL